MKIHTVRKKGLTQALQVTDDESARTVRAWLEEAGHDPAADLSELTAEGSYFMRDQGSEIVYLCSKADYARNWEVIDAQFSMESPPSSVQQEFHDQIQDILKDFG